MSPLSSSTPDDIRANKINTAQSGEVENITRRYYSVPQTIPTIKNMVERKNSPTARFLYPAHWHHTPLLGMVWPNRVKASPTSPPTCSQPILLVQLLYRKKRRRRRSTKRPIATIFPSRMRLPEKTIATHLTIYPPPLFQILASSCFVRSEGQTNGGDLCAPNPHFLSNNSCVGLNWSADLDILRTSHLQNT